MSGTINSSELGYLYRFEGKRYAPMHDEFNRTSYGSRLTVEMFTYPILRATPCGNWISYGCCKKFVNKNARKQFAHTTIEGARESFVARKKRQISILKAQLADAERCLQLVQLPLDELL